jgi:hypothetical protein
MDPPANTVCLDCDKEGIEYLIQRLKVQISEGDHEHLFSPAWGGWELSGDEVRPGHLPVHHLRITVVD